MGMCHLTVRSTDGEWQKEVDSWTSLVNDLKNRAGGADFVRSVNEAFGHLRAGQDAVATQSAAQEFRESLETISRKFSDVTPKCPDLQSRLDEVLRRIS